MKLHEKVKAICKARGSKNLFDEYKYRLSNDVMLYYDDVKPNPTIEIVLETESSYKSMYQYIEGIFEDNYLTERIENKIDREINEISVEEII